MPAPKAGRARSAEQEELWRSDSWRMQHMKVAPCHKRYAHDWSTCPFAHPRDAARRRDPQLHAYTGIACPAMKQDGHCDLGDACPFAHNVFEYWLHPTRYRTQLCKDGKDCRRWLCFFSHSLEELRVPECKPWLPSPEMLTAAQMAAAAAAAEPGKRLKLGGTAAPQQRRQQQQQLSSLPSCEHQEAAQAVTAAAAHLRQQQQQQAAAAEAAAAPQRPSLDMDLPNAADTSAHQVLSAALLQPHLQPQQQGHTALVDLLLGLLERGEVSADKSAAILQRLLPPEALSNLQVQLANPEPCSWETSRYSDPLCHYESREHLLRPLPSSAVTPPGRASADSLCGSTIGWASGAGDAVPGAHAPPTRLSAQYYGQPATPALLEQLAALHSAATSGSVPGALPAADFHLQGTAASRLLAAGGSAHTHLAPMPLGQAPRLPYYAGSVEGSVDSAGSSLGAAFPISEGSSPSRCSVEAGEADPGSEPDGDPQYRLLGLQQLRLGSPTGADSSMPGQ